MAKSTPETSGRSSQRTSKDSPRSTSSPESPAGHEPSTSHTGPELDLFGQPVAHAHRSPSQESKRSAFAARQQTLSAALDELASSYAPTANTHGSQTTATYGRKCGGSSPSADLQQSLESRLKALLVGTGSPVYALRWRYSDMLLGVRICALRASARTTSGNDSSGWPSTSARDHKTEGEYLETRMDETRGMQLAEASLMAGFHTPMLADQRGKTGPNSNSSDLGHQVTLFGTVPSGGHAGTERSDESRPAGWQSPQPRDHKGQDPQRKENRTGNRHQGDCLPTQAMNAAGWATTKKEDAECAGTRHTRGVADTLYAQSSMAGIPTPRTHTGGPESLERKKELGRTDSGGSDLQAVAQTFQPAGMSTPMVNQGNGGEYNDPEKAIRRATRNEYLDIRDQAHLFSLPNMEGWKLNPAFSLWLQGFPEQWIWSAPIHRGRSTQDTHSQAPVTP